MAANSNLTQAVHALCWLELARRRGETSLTSERIAASLDTHPVALRRTLAPLRSAGLLVTGRGRGSGWSLARGADTISLADVYAALGSEPLFALHPHEPNLECPVGFGIRPVLDDVFDDVRRAVQAELGKVTVATLLDDLLTSHPLPA